MKSSNKRNSYIVAVLTIAILVLSSISAAAAGSTVKLSGQSVPTKITVGKSFTIKGTISSNKTIKRIEVGVVNRSKNTWTSQKYDNKAVNSKTFNLSTADPHIKFGKLKAGNYMYRIYAHTSDGKVHIVLNEAFKVVAKKTSNSSSKSSKAATSTVNKTVKGTSSKVKLRGANTPKTYKVGKKVNIKGTVKSNVIIKRIEVGIVIDATNKWTEYKYDKKINAKSFDLSQAASTLRFDRLPGGTYRYRIYAHTADKVHIVLDKKFKVTPSNKPKKAVKWAKKIAADDSFTYGQKPAANALGCYFCGTNHGPVKYYKPKGYEKTYVCLTFVGAAYAHGAKDPEMLDKCKRGKMTMWETDMNFSYFSCWMKIGSCRDLTVDDLQVGDVIVQWSDYNDNNGHVCMYIGNNSIVEASGGGWGANSIAVKKGVAASRLKSLSSNKKNYVMRYRN